MLSHMVDVVKHLARQNQALKGSTQKIDVTSGINSEEPNGNLWQTLCLVSKYSQPLPKLMQKAQNYTSPKVQNELLKLMARNVLRSVAVEVREAMCYSVTIDETTDCTNQEQAVFCFRYAQQYILYCAMNCLQMVE